MSENTTHYGTVDTSKQLKPLELTGVVATIKKNVYEQNHDRTTLTLIIEELPRDQLLKLTEITHSKKPVKLSMQTISRGKYE